MSSETFINDNANDSANDAADEATSSEAVTTQKQALRTLDQLGAYVITTKSAETSRREVFVDEVLKTLSLYRNKVSKAEEPEQFGDIVTAAKNELQTVFERHQAQG